LFAWPTGLPLSRQTAVGVATEAGRPRWMIDSEGFNRQKNGGMRLEHVSSTDPDKPRVYYLWWQVAHLLLLLVEKGSRRRRLTAERGQAVRGWFGSGENVGKRLPEGLRNWARPEEGFTPPAGKPTRVGLDSSEARPRPSAREGVNSRGGQAERSSAGRPGCPRWARRRRFAGPPRMAPRPRYLQFLIPVIRGSSLPFSGAPGRT
jgi:hypothetical protein